MPNQITARKTRNASAASVSRWAVGGWTLGTRADQLATKMKTNNVPIKARYGPGSTCIVSRIWLSTVSTMSSKAAWVVDGTSDSRPLTRNPPATSTTMIAQVTTTASVIGAGPRWKSGALVRGEAGIGRA